MPVLEHATGESTLLAESSRALQQGDVFQRSVMKRVFLPFCLLTLVLVAIGLLLPARNNIKTPTPTTVEDGSSAANYVTLGVRDADGGQFDQSASDRDAVEGMPPALRRHYEELMKTIPGGGKEGPALSAAEWRFMERAYPLKDISLAKTEGARAAHDAKVTMAFAANAASPAAASTAAKTWTWLGPTRALYPFTPLRNVYSYVPNAYEAGGRTTFMAIASVCVPHNCRLWITPAGGGVWRTDDALQTYPAWTYLAGSFGINAASSITLDPNDSNVIWVGTGEANASADSEAGVGLYKSTDGGDTWTGPIGKSKFNARAIGSIAIDPTDSNTMYVATTRAIRGMSSVTGGAVTLAPGAPPWGLYKTTDGGAHWSFLFNGASLTTGCSNPTNVASNLTPCSPRGVRRVVLDPSNPKIVYASAYARGVWRSSNGGSTWQQIFLPIADPVATSYTERAEIAVTKLANGSTRMYLGIGQLGSPASQFYRSDSTAGGGTPSFTLLTSSDPANPGYATYNYCEGQCWYDNFVYTPPGYPDIVYVGGSYAYGETGGISNGRGVVLSTDGGQTFTDVTMDATSTLHPNGLHPDQHSLVTNPGNPMQFFESNDGGVMRSSTQYTDVSSVCGTRGLSGTVLARCVQLLSRVPKVLHGINRGVSSLQFQSVSVSPFDYTLLQGGTQDNGTWQSTTTPGLFRQSMFGDGGQSGFDIGNPKFRFHTYYLAQVDVNFTNGVTSDWNWIADPIVGTGGAFYIPIISDPAVSKTMFAGTNTVYRTKTNGMGTMNLSTFRYECNEFTGHFEVQCGDWVPLGTTALTSSSLGTWAGGVVAAVQRTASDASTLWVATSTGRIFISKNADADPASSVTFTRLDTTSSLAPNRFISGIAIDPGNANHVWISYCGYSASTPSTRGHIFEVTYDPNTQTANFVDRSVKMSDLPLTGVAYDSNTGDLYVSSDFGVYRMRSGTTYWALAAKGMPNVEVAGLTLVPQARLLYAATHGLGVYVLQLP
jgi:hypothetical protein